MNFNLILTVLFVGFLTISCGSDKPKAVAETGSSLYSANCASCHGQLAVSTKRNANANQIKAAIQNTVEMQTASLQALTDAQLILIAQALSQ